ncbi:hypothetical protein ODU39_04070 [Streptococcus sp. 2021WUSS126]|nr:hypothetical protein [Streptococcus suis]HEM6177173.1 hypothetical protein [Streptococcus suis]HEM6509681.1 hypothetical protein [Streptococcus suis]
MGRFGYGTKEVLYPRFRKIEQVYRKKYNQRSRKHQLIYYAGFVMIYSVTDYRRNVCYRGSQIDDW